MFSLNFFPKTPSFHFTRYFKIAASISGLAVLLSMGLFIFLGLNFGIDFKGGILIEARSQQIVDIATIRNQLEQLDLGDSSIQSFGSPNDILVRVQKQEGDENSQIIAIEKVTNALGDNFTIRRTEFVGPTIGAELAEKGILAVLCALLAILIYIWFRFEWQFSIAAIIAISHDIITTIGLFSLTNFEFNLTTIAALLTIAGYSINDTVVVFDRVRENLRKFKSWDQRKILDRSLNETLSRTVVTSLTTAIALIAIILFGGAVLRDFALAMLWGVIIGTYSSIFIAVGTISYFNLRPADTENHIPKPEYEQE